MQQSNLPAEFWAHAVCTAAYILNRLSHRRLEGKITPYERVFCQRPNLKNLQVFGCHAEILIEKQYRRKDLAYSASDSAIFIGYCRQSTGYVFYVPKNNTIVSRRDAVFNPAYYPARVGDSVLIGLKDSCIGITDAKNNDSKNSDAKNSIGNAETGAAKNNDENAKNSIEKSDKQRVSPRPLLGQIGKPAASAGLVPLKPFDAKKPLVPATPSQTYFIKSIKTTK